MVWQRLTDLNQLAAAENVSLGIGMQLVAGRQAYLGEKVVRENEYLSAMAAVLCYVQGRLRWILYRGQSCVPKV